MKNNKKIITAAVALVVMVAAGVTTFFIVKGNNGGNGDSGQSGQEASKGNCSVFECIEKLNSKMTLAEMNDIMGFEGELVTDEESYKTYSWELTEDTSIRSQFMTSYNTATISANYPSSAVPKTSDFSRWTEIQSKLRGGEDLYYDEFVELVGGTQGVMKQKSSSSVTYEWENADGGYLSGYFNDDGKCTMATGRF
ncbi:hypothetical protein IKH83_02330 [Candidatus Saccharibacteria bacterium]|nr:hypothetical protein [Candidatus Saccharibacteria bacterium]